MENIYKFTKRFSMIAGVFALGLVACEKDEIAELNRDIARVEFQSNANDAALQSALDTLRSQLNSRIEEVQGLLQAAIDANGAEDDADNQAQSDALAAAQALLQAAIDLSSDQSAAALAAAQEALQDLIEINAANDNAQDSAQSAALAAAQSALSRAIAAGDASTALIASNALADAVAAQLVVDTAQNESIESLQTRVTDQVSRLDGLIDDLEDEDASFAQLLSGLRAEFNTLLGRFNSLEAGNATQAELDAAIADLDALTARVVAVEAFQSRISTLESEVAALEIAVAAQSETDGTHASTLTTIQTSINNLRTSLETFATNGDTTLQNAINAEIARLDNLIVGINAEIDGHDTAIRNLQTNVANATMLANAANAAIAGLNIPDAVTITSSGTIITISVGSDSYEINTAGGAAGGQGAQGPIGPAGTSFDSSLFSVVSADVAGGTQITISYNGVQLSQFVVADGEDGEDGEDGAQGPQGPAGGDAADTIGEFGSWSGTAPAATVEYGTFGSWSSAPAATLVAGTPVITVETAGADVAEVTETTTTPQESVVAAYTRTRSRSAVSVVASYTETRSRLITVNGAADNDYTSLTDNGDGTFTETQSRPVAESRTNIADDVESEDVAEVRTPAASIVTTREIANPAYVAPNGADYWEYTPFAGTPPAAVISSGTPVVTVETGAPNSQEFLTETTTTPQISTVAAYTQYRTANLVIVDAADSPAPVRENLNRNFQEVVTQLPAIVTTRQIPNPNYVAPVAQVWSETSGVWSHPAYGGSYTTPVEQNTLFGVVFTTVVTFDDATTGNYQGTTAAEAHTEAQTALINQ